MTCHCCGFEDPVGGVKEYSGQGLCRICANTPAGSAFFIPSRFNADILPVLKTVAYVGNLLLKEAIQ